MQSDWPFNFFQVQEYWAVNLESSGLDTLSNTEITRLLQNAKVMTREKQGEAAEKVLLMGKNPLKNGLV